MAAYYNEIDSFAASWLRELIKENLIAPGIVDERSIADVSPNDLMDFDQCHFFAGIGGWSLALRLAGWPDDRPVWTGSCPCQSFSAAGKGAGFEDPRHLWPAFYRLIEKCRPVAVFGEQVEAAIRHGWLDLVQTDLEASNYAFGAVVFPACGIGAPHIRSRLYWVADANNPNRQPITSPREMGGEECLGKSQESQPGNPGKTFNNCCSVGRLADTDDNGLDQGRGSLSEAGNDGFIGNRSIGRLANAESSRRGICDTTNKRQTNEQVYPPTDPGYSQPDGQQRPASECPRPTNGQWETVDWLYCRDGKWRPVEPGTFPLAHGVSNRVGLLRGYGNAIVPAQAAAFIEAAMR